ncbi:hypothetical protein HYS92_00770 [Candidatus Daviesbacteria bacterium]|nr:hypothetical protein [Candidatus Daviesbacteria bacterium]
MQLLLLHGSAKVISRKKLLQDKAKFDGSNVVVFEEGSNIEEILASLTTMPLLQGERLVILENPDENFQPPTINPLPTNLIVWFDHEITEKKPIFDYFKKNGQVLFFPEKKERSIFSFLDMLASGEDKAHLELKKLKEAGFEIQYFITMIFYLLRNLVVTPKNAPSFVAQKLMRQRKRFDQEKIKNLYKSTLEIDFKIKSGQLEMGQAEFILINQFL